MMRQVYMDHAATTPVASEVLKEMMPYFTESFGNPSSLYTLGQQNKEVVRAAREKVAEVLNASPMRYILRAAVQNRIIGL